MVSSDHPHQNMISRCLYISIALACSTSSAIDRPEAQNPPQGETITVDSDSDIGSGSLLNDTYRL